MRIICLTLLVQLTFMSFLGTVFASPTAPQAPQATETEQPIRESRPFAARCELGWNGLAGLGLNFSYNINPKIAVDLGAGVSATGGGKYGIRARYNLVTKNWTPFVGLGFVRTSGFGDQILDIDNGKDSDDDEPKESVSYRVRSASHLQAVVGVDYVASYGLTFMTTAGYSSILNNNTLEYISGSKKMFDEIKFLSGSGIVLSTAIGYAF